MRYIFGRFLMDTDRFELFANGKRLSVEPQVFDLLNLLVENHHRLVGKDEIHRTIWAGKCVSESALSSRIKMLRRVLGDDGKRQALIRTVHGKGFRFIGPLDRSEHDHSGSIDPLPLADLPKRYTKPSIIVIPFRNLSSDPQQEYFSDGISADIIMLLSKHRWLEVAARNTSFGLKKDYVDFGQLSEAMHLDYAVEGSVQKLGSRVRISAQLIDMASGTSKWADRFDRELTDIFSLQDELTTRIVARLEPEIGFAERRRVVQQRPSSLQAWDYFHLGVFHFFRFTAADNLKAQEMLRKSTELDTFFGDAYAWWAYAMVLGMVYWDTAPSESLLQQALVACNKALSFDNQNATYYTLRGRVQLARRQYRSAIQDNENAIALNPSLAAAHCGLGDSLAYEGRYAEAVACFDRAISLSPNDPQAWAFLTYGALAFIFMGDYERALALSEQALRFPNCQYWTLAHRVVIYAYLHREEEMKIELANLLQVQPRFSIRFARQKLFYLSLDSQRTLYLNGLNMAGVPA